MLFFGPMMGTIMVCESEIMPIEVAVKLFSTKDQFLFSLRIVLFSNWEAKHSELSEI